MMDPQDEYQYRTVRSEIRPVQSLSWRRIDEVPEYSVLDTINQTEPQKNEPFSIDSFFTNKIEQDSFRLGLLTHQLEDRENLKRKHLHNIDQSLIYCHSKIDTFNHMYVGRNKGVDRTIDQLSHEIFGLEQQQRQEENAAWKDQTGILKDFLEAWTAYRGDLWTYSALNPKDDLSNRSTPRK